ncbi:glycohydrolase toxin TNT-related protein [Anaerorhabdus sp.]|uniref:glycohydrolase toxin TNT-related protein n=1 Tax=Anaerorhabdus sp. TaxID=1872524 RepID=UPI003FA5257F
MIDRYGSNGIGKFFSPKGTPYGDRVIPPFMENKPYIKYEILKPMTINNEKLLHGLNNQEEANNFYQTFQLINFEI